MFEAWRSQMDDHTRKQQHLFYEQWDCSASDEHLNVQKEPLVRLKNPSRWYHAAMSQCLKSEIEQRSNVGRGQRTLRISADFCKCSR